MTPTELAVAALWFTGGVIGLRLMPKKNQQSTAQPTNAQRLAAWERRLGEHRARKRIQAERVYQLIDQRNARRIVAMSRAIKQEAS